MLTFNADVTFNRAGTLLEIKKREQDALRTATKYAHKSARHAIRISKTPAKPGKPPHSRKGVLKNAIASRLNLDEMTATVGISQQTSKASLARIAGLHEYGGTVTSPPLFRIGSTGPLRIAGKKGTGGGPFKRYAFAPIKTAAQEARAKKIAVKVIGAQAAAGRNVYPERPFMAPTLEKTKPYILKLLQRKGFITTR